MENQRYYGIVREFNVVRGTGYIMMDGAEAPIFVRYSAIEGQGVRTLREGERVSFEIERNGRGLLNALHVVRM